MSEWQTPVSAMKQYPAIIILLALAGMADSSPAAAQDRGGRLPAALADGWRNLLARQTPAVSETAAAPLDSAPETTATTPVGPYGTLNWSILLTDAVEPATLLPAELSATTLAVWLLGGDNAAKPLSLTRWLQESARRWATHSSARLIYQTLGQAIPPDPPGSLPVLFADPLPGGPPPEPLPLVLEPVTITLK
jgi:hypothetical protein